MFRKITSVSVAATFLFSMIMPVPGAMAGEMVMPVMPPPGTMVALSSSYAPAFLKGIIIHPDNALQFDFLIHKGDGNLDSDQKKEEYTKLVKYFLASLTITDKDQWVNLSPYEKNRIIEDNFGKTEMGRDLLSQDYLLKQLTSSLMYPESGLGRKFWDKVYERAYKEYGSTNIPINTFNKVWIMPDTAVVYESGNTAYILKSHLKVMLEEDYLSLEKHSGVKRPNSFVNTIGSQIVRQIILPEIEKEVNEGKNFAMLRQIYSGMVLATWYKKVLKESLLGKIYADKAKVKGVDTVSFPNASAGDPDIIYREYLKAFKKGVFNFIKEDDDKYTRQSIPRKYFAGGFLNSSAMRVTKILPAGEGKIIRQEDDEAMVNLKVYGALDAAMYVPDQITLAAALLPVSLASAAFMGFKYYVKNLTPWGIERYNKDDLVLTADKLEKHYRNLGSRNRGGAAGSITDGKPASSRETAIQRMNNVISVKNILIDLRAGENRKRIKLRAALLKILGKSGDREAVSDLLGMMLENTEYPEIKEGAYEASAGIIDSVPTILGFPGLKDRLLGLLLTDLSKEDRKRIETLLKKLGKKSDGSGIKEEMLNVYKGVFKGNNPGLIQAAAEAMKRLEKEHEAEIFFLDLLKSHDQQEYIYAQAAFALGVLGNENAVIFLIQHDTRHGVVIAALKGLYHSHPVDEIEVLEKLQRKFQLKNQESKLISLILADVHYRDSNTMYGQDIKQAEGHMRLIAANGPGLLFDGLRDYLYDYLYRLAVRQLLRDPDETIRQKARQALEKFGRYVDQLMDFASDEEMPDFVERGKLSIAGSPDIVNNDKAALAKPGGIDLNSADLDLIIRRDGRGVPLPLARQDMAQLSRLGGFIPEIIEIRPAAGLSDLNL